jgi:putative acetyltransferase
MDIQNTRLEFFSPESAKDYEQVKEIFKEYQVYLNIDLCFQRFDNELATLNEIYKPPKGAIILAKLNDQIAGCIALKPIEDNNCEMKRLYVKPMYRGHNIGKKLVELIIEYAKNNKYTLMKLDTVDKLVEAIDIYQKMGFKKTEPYVYNPLSDVLYFEKDLT